MFFVKFVLLFLVTFFVIGIIVSNFKEFGVTKTVGWAWDISSFVLPLFIIYTSTYLALLFLKVKTNLIVSIVSILSILACLVLNNSLFIIVFLSSILLFLYNCLHSVILKFKQF